MEYVTAVKGTQMEAFVIAPYGKQEAATLEAL